MPPGWRAKADGAALAALLLCLVLLCGRALLGELVDLRDLPRWVWPLREAWRQALLSGRLPQWNPYVGLGVPALAAPVYGTLYPGNLLVLLLPTWWSLPATWF